MSMIVTQIDSRSTEFQKASEHLQALVEDGLLVRTSLVSLPHFCGDMRYEE